MPAVFFVVRATVSDPAKRQAFDEWYHREHLPDAVKAFVAKKAWRLSAETRTQPEKLPCPGGAGPIRCRVPFERS